MPKGGYADVDQFPLDVLLVYRTLVLVHSPSASRPPSSYRHVWSGSYYDVWQRPEPSGRRVIEHLPLGDGTQPAAVPPCGEVLRLGRVAGANKRASRVRRPGRSHGRGPLLRQHAAGWRTPGDTTGTF